jgi:hypothetical protein
MGKSAVHGDECPGIKRCARALLGWEPQQPGLIADVDQPGNFES